MMTYTISVVCSYWYYGDKTKSVFAAYGIMIKQFGSLVFAAMVIAVVTFARMMVDQKRHDGNNKNIAAAVCLCLLSCILKAI